MPTQLGPSARLSWHVIGALGAILSLALIAAASLITRHQLSSAVGIWLGAAVVVAAMLYTVVRSHPSRGWWLAWPALALLLVGTFSRIDQPVAGLVVGLVTLTFLYVGLTQPPGRSLFLLPVGLLVLWSALNLSPAEAAVRLSITAITLTAVAELPAQLLRQLAHKQQALTKASQIDPLTGALNRQNLAEALNTDDDHTFVVMIDLDFFKRHNDLHGHLSGDRVLVDFTAVLQADSRSTDQVIRYGGEEFLVILHGVDADSARAAVTRWAAAWAQNPCGLTFSAGLTDLRGSDTLARADKALYAAKSAGRNRIVVSLAEGSAEHEFGQSVAVDDLHRLRRSEHDETPSRQFGERLVQ